LTPRDARPGAGDDLDELPRRVQELPVRCLPRAAGRIAEAKAIVRVRLNMESTTTNQPTAPMPVKVDQQESLRCIDVNEAARLLSLKPSRVYDLVRTRRLPAVKLGKYVRIRMIDVEKFLRQARG
jgi:excisionase family DNA binding protein